VTAKLRIGSVSMEEDECLNAGVEGGRIQGLSTSVRRCIEIRLVESRDPRGASERDGCIGIAS